MTNCMQTNPSDFNVFINMGNFCNNTNDLVHLEIDFLTSVTMATLATTTATDGSNATNLINMYDSIEVFIDFPHFQDLLRKFDISERLVPELNSRYKAVKFWAEKCRPDGRKSLPSYRKCRCCIYINSNDQLPCHSASSFQCSFHIAQAAITTERA